MRSRKKVISLSQKQRQAEEAAKQHARLPFFNKLTRKFPAKAGGVLISALIVLHFVSQFIFFQNEIAPDEVAPPNIENVQIVQIIPEYESLLPDVVEMPEPAARSLVAERKAEPIARTFKKKQSRETKAERPRRADRTKRVFPAEEVASLYPHGRFLLAR